MYPTITILTDTPPTLQEAQRFVGGYVERLVLPDSRIMLLNEDGKLLHLTVNNPATLLSGGHLIVGNVVILEGDAQKGWKEPCE